MAVALLTDFGLSDTYVGVMKGVMLSIDPETRFVDLTHGIEPQNVRQAALSLMQAVRYFPQGTVFLVVVDPGVGSTRRPIAVQAGGYSFVAPDNGVLSYALGQWDEVRAVEITHSLPETSNTFHGRDIFAPAAAKLASGAALESLGEPLKRVVSLPMPQLEVDKSGRVFGEVVHIDRFGNLITSIGQMRWLSDSRLSLTPAFGHGDEPLPVSSEHAEVHIAGTSIKSIRHTYSEAERGALLMLIGSSSFLEISVNQGSAAARLDAAIGDRVELYVGDVNAAVLD